MGDFCPILLKIASFWPFLTLNHILGAWGVVHFGWIWCNLITVNDTKLFCAIFWCSCLTMWKIKGFSGQSGHHFALLCLELILVWSPNRPFDRSKVCVIDLKIDQFIVLFYLVRNLAFWIQKLRWNFSFIRRFYPKCQILSPPVDGVFEGNLYFLGRALSMPTDSFHSHIFWTWSYTQQIPLSS